MMLREYDEIACGSIGM
jgi:hypothetical protein